MIFNSIHYLLFLPLVIFLYYAMKPRYRWILLLIGSYYFYMCWRAEYILLIVASTLIDFYVARAMGRETERKRRRKYLLLSLVSNLGLLFFFKYGNFFGDTLNDLFAVVNVSCAIPYFNVLLPVGISFYTFQTLSYTIDVYYGWKKPETHLGIFAVYVAYFPQLVAGPIERSTHLIPQLKEHFRFSYDNLSKGFKLILWGFFLKLVIADRAAIYVNAVYNNVDQHDGLSFLAATFFFAFQIYGDFAGYSAIAIGSSRLMGVDLMENFNQPYFATSIQNFWRRWHISLSTWFRDYLYIPLGGNRVSRERWLFNLFITFVISGLWHGANWTFVIWGALHGGYLIVEALMGKKKREGLHNVVLTFFLVNLAWIFFRANTVGDAFLIVREIFTRPGQLFIPGGADIVAPVYTVIGIVALLLIEVKREYFDDSFTVFRHRSEWVRMLGYSLLLAGILYLGVFGESQFIYFQF
jgi:D-alanyl-lipoteichoic acid acyltransferase DltB (MBOAT superfamily)